MAAAVRQKPGEIKKRRVSEIDGDAEPETEQEDGPVAQADVEAASERTDEGTGRGRDPETGRFREGHQKLGGRVAGTPNVLPRSAYQVMKEMIAGRILKVLKDEEGNETGEQKSVAEIMADVIFEAMEGKLILSSGKHGVTYVNPLHAVRLLHDYMLKAKELSIRARALKKEKRSGGGIRIVLPRSRLIHS